MRNHAGDVVDGKTGLLERLFRSVEHGDDRLFVNVLAGHVNGSKILIGIFGGDRHSAAAAWHEKDVGELSVTPDVCADDAVTAAAMRRSLMPVRVVIHSSLVSTIFERSAFVRIFSGT